MKKIITSILCCTMALPMVACTTNSASAQEVTEEQIYIEETLNLANNEALTWTYSTPSDAWVMGIVSAVAYPELPDQQGVSVCVPGAYVTGIDTDGDGTADVFASNGEEAVSGSLVIDYDATITSTNGQVYTASTAPVILNTGAAGYGSQNNSLAQTTYAADGYINIACGNRGKNDTAVDESGTIYYTGDAPSCLVDQKAAARFVKYNILLGNLPGSTDYFVSTGGSGGGAHATMFAATSNNEDYYDYQIAVGAVGVYQNADGSYNTSVTIDDTSHEISDGAWGCIAYSAITSLAEADMALAFEYNLDTTYDFKTSFQSQLAEYLSQAYMEYINNQNLTVAESAIGFDLDGDNALTSTIALSIGYDLEAYPETNGYYGSYLDLYLAEFTQNLQWYLDSLDYAEGWTWFDENGTAVTDLANFDKATAFLEGRYAKSASGKGAMGGGAMGDRGTMGDGFMGDRGAMTGELPANFGTPPDGAPQNTMEVGTPDAGTTQSASGSGIDSANYATFAEMLASYQNDIAQIEAGDTFGNNIVDLYNPLIYINAETTENPTWAKIVMGASEGDMSLFSSLNLQIAWLNADVDAEIEWQWDGGHVPSEVLGNSFSLYVDEMYGEYTAQGTTITKATATTSTNGTAETATGTNISTWVNGEDVTNVSFTLADIAAYRTAGASKAIPAFDVIDYGQEDYVFGNTEVDARHWNKYLLAIYEIYQETLSPLFNAS